MTYGPSAPVGGSWGAARRQERQASMVNLYVPQSFGFTLIFEREPIDRERAMHYVRSERRSFRNGRAQDTTATLASFYEAPGDTAEQVRARSKTWAREQGYVTH